MKDKTDPKAAPATAPKNPHTEMTSSRPVSTAFRFGQEATCNEDA